MLPTGEPGVLAAEASSRLTRSWPTPAASPGRASRLAWRHPGGDGRQRRAAGSGSSLDDVRHRVGNMTLGMKPGELIIAAGRPGMGKSTFGVALQAALANSGVYFVSLEMEAQQLAERALASLLVFDEGDSVRPITGSLTAGCPRPICSGSNRRGQAPGHSADDRGAGWSDGVADRRTGASSAGALGAEGGPPGRSWWTASRAGMPVQTLRGQPF